MRTIKLNNGVDMPGGGRGGHASGPMRRLELSAHVGGNEAVNPFMETETYRKQHDGSWQMLSFVYTRIMRKNCAFRLLSE